MSLRRRTIFLLSRVSSTTLQKEFADMAVSRICQAEYMDASDSFTDALDKSAVK